MKKSELGIRRADVVERFVRSSGPGGQNVNKTATCVYLKHLATGIEVKCQRERTQRVNRRLAWALLLDKVAQHYARLRQEEQGRLQRLKRQSRRRSASARERMLEEKRRHAQKKRLRGRVPFDSDE